MEPAEHMREFVQHDSSRIMASLNNAIRDSGVIQDVGLEGDFFSIIGTGYQIRDNYIAAIAAIKKKITDEKWLQVTSIRADIPYDAAAGLTGNQCRFILVGYRIRT